MDRKVKGKDVETDSAAQSLGRINKATPQLHLAWIMRVLVANNVFLHLERLEWGK